MSDLTLPIPSPVPLDVLRGPVFDLVNTPLPNTRWWTRNSATRLILRCHEHGIDHVWMLLLFPWDEFVKLKNSGARTAKLADEVLGSIGGEFRMFPELLDTLETVARDSSYQEGLSYVGLAQVLMALAGIGDWAKEPAIITALAAHDLRPNMPLEELFVYVPPASSV